MRERDGPMAFQDVGSPSRAFRPRALRLSPHNAPKGQRRRGGWLLFVVGSRLTIARAS